MISDADNFPPSEKRASRLTGPPIATGPKNEDAPPRSATSQSKRNRRQSADQAHDTKETSRAVEIVLEKLTGSASALFSSAARVEAAAAFLQSPFLVASLVEGMQAAVIRMHSPWLNRQDAADYARCCISEIDRAAELGVIKKYKRGGSPLFKRVDIDSAIEDGKWTPAKSKISSTN